MALTQPLWWSSALVFSLELLLHDFLLPLLLLLFELPPQFLPSLPNFIWLPIVSEQLLHFTSQQRRPYNHEYEGKHWNTWFPQSQFHLDDQHLSNHLGSPSMASLSDQNTLQYSQWTHISALWDLERHLSNHHYFQQLHCTHLLIFAFLTRWQQPQASYSPFLLLLIWIPLKDSLLKLLYPFICSQQLEHGWSWAATLQNSQQDFQVCFYKSQWVLLSKLLRCHLTWDRQYPDGLLPSFK